jgi:TRAP-type transport system periplasmic protein
MRPKQILALAAGLAAISAPAMAQEVTLQAMTSLPKTLQLAQSFLDNFIPQLNAAGKGVIQVNYIGGPEITPPRKAAAALKRGVFQMLQSPTAYYIGMVPEGYALTLSQKTPAELRANGGFALLQKIWAEKAGARLLAWSESGTRYHTYLATEPKFDANGNLSLKGIKMRVTGTYRPLFKSLGATTIGIKATEIYTGIQRGVVQGFGWPDVGIVGLGLHKLVKYRIDPPFYKANMTVSMNLKSYNGLPRKAKDILERVAIEYEGSSIAYMEGERSKEEKMAMDAGMKIIKLKGANASNYLKAANAAVWKSLQERSKSAMELKKKSFPDLEG